MNYDTSAHRMTLAIQCYNIHVINNKPITHNLFYDRELK